MLNLNNHHQKPAKLQLRGVLVLVAMLFIVIVSCLVSPTAAAYTNPTTNIIKIGRFIGAYLSKKFPGLKSNCSMLIVVIQASKSAYIFVLKSQRKPIIIKKELCKISKYANGRFKWRCDQF